MYLTQDVCDAWLTRWLAGGCRLYIMTLPNKGMTFDRITHHARVTQCLCGLGPDPWYLAVAKPTYAPVLT